MTLHLHISSKVSNKVRNFLSNNFFVSIDANNWLDCTYFIKDFNPNKISDFVTLVIEAIGIDLAFDKWEFRY
jgi:hypothetical protein